MKKIIVLIVLISLFLLPQTGAQDKSKKTPEDKARRKTTEMVTSLMLSKEQENMLYSVNLKSYQSIAVYEAKKPSKKMKKKQKDLVQEMREKEFKKILSPAQYSQYRKLEAEEDKREEAEKLQKKKQEELEKKNKSKGNSKDNDETIED